MEVMPGHSYDYSWPVQIQPRWENVLMMFIPLGCLICFRGRRRNSLLMCRSYEGMYFQAQWATKPLARQATEQALRNKNLDSI